MNILYSFCATTIMNKVTMSTSYFYIMFIPFQNRTTLIQYNLTAGNYIS